MNRKQLAIIARFRRLVRDAHAAGLVLAVDAEAWALRFIPREAAATADHLGDVGEAVEFPDVRGVDDALGESVSVDSACGTPANTCATI